MKTTESAQFIARLLVVWLGLMLGALPAAGQVSSVEMDVDRSGGFVGLGGLIRPGTWMPLRVTLANNSSQLRQVEVRWLVDDSDGDRVIARRSATLNPGRQDSQVWLYACPPMTTRQNVHWKAQTVDLQTGRLLESMSVFPSRGQVVPVDSSAIGILGTHRLGLEDYAHTATSHEPIELITGLSLASLPDRWFGLSLAQALVWTEGGGEGGDPNSEAFTGPIRQALRQWIRRGGHLVLCLPPVGQPWSGSPLADLMPVKAGRMQRVSEFPPSDLLGSVQGAQRVKVPIMVFDVEGLDDVAVIAKDDQNRPVAVAKRFGLGMVTLIGMDLADRKYARMGLPNGPRTIWNKVFHWQNPAMAPGQIRPKVRKQKISRPETRPTAVLAQWLPSQIVMVNTAAPALLAAIVVFALYWLFAGPVAHGMLKYRGLTRHSWLAFVGSVALFTAVAWGGAALMQPGRTELTHFSVLDLDGNTGQARAQSWMSVFVPEFGDARFAVDPDHEQAHQTLASPGMHVNVESGRFPDRRSYQMPAADPDHYEVPIRGTSKQFKAQYMGKLSVKQSGLDQTWPMPRGKVTLGDQFWPKGELVHHLPGALEDLLIVYCPGDNQMPWLWRPKKAWAPGLPLELTPPKHANHLVQRPDQYKHPRQWVAEGFLGQLIGYKVGSPQAKRVIQQNQGGFGPTSQVNMKQELDMLSFFAALPPPDFRDTKYRGTATTFRRRYGHRLDLSELISGRRLIILGHLNNSPLPMPLTVNGQIPALANRDSQTFVRYILDF